MRAAFQRWIWERTGDFPREHINLKLDSFVFEFVFQIIILVFVLRISRKNLNAAILVKLFAEIKSARYILFQRGGT